MIRECLFKNTEEIALVPVELSYYARAGGNRADQKKILTLENVMTQVVRINFSEPILASDYSNASEPVSLLGNAIVSRWKSDAFVYPHYLFCRILREAHYSVPMDDLSERINDFLQKRHLWDCYEIRDILREGMAFTLKNELGLIEGGNLIVTKKDEVNYYANLV
jgi:hypothetical protein